MSTSLGGRQTVAFSFSLPVLAGTWWNGILRLAFDSKPDIAANIGPASSIEAPSLSLALIAAPPLGVKRLEEDFS